MRPYPPFANTLKVPADNPFVYVTTGDKGKRMAEGVQRNCPYKITNVCLWLPIDADPLNYRWPVPGCRVVVLDFLGLYDDELVKLHVALLEGGATSAVHHDFVRGRAEEIIKLKDAEDA